MPRMETLDEVLHICARNVRARRSELDMTRAQLAKRAKLSYSYISGIERAEGNPRINTIAAIARALKVKPRQLFET